MRPTISCAVSTAPFAEFEKNATDAELADLADTRTARAFMLFGRVTGTFD
jgi:hypothetical protein